MDGAGPSLFRGLVVVFASQQVSNNLVTRAEYENEIFTKKHKVAIDNHCVLAYPTKQRQDARNLQLAKIVQVVVICKLNELLVDAYEGGEGEIFASQHLNLVVGAENKQAASGADNFEKMGRHQNLHLRL